VYVRQLRLVLRNSETYNHEHSPAELRWMYVILVRAENCFNAPETLQKYSRVCDYGSQNIFLQYRRFERTIGRLSQSDRTVSDAPFSIRPKGNEGQMRRQTFGPPAGAKIAGFAPD